MRLSRRFTPQLDLGMAKRTVHRVSPLRENTPMVYATVSDCSMMEVAEPTPGLLFDLEGFVADSPTSVKQISDAAPETVEQLRSLLQPNSDAEKLVSAHVWAP